MLKEDANTAKTKQIKDFFSKHKKNKLKKQNKCNGKCREHGVCLHCFSLIFLCFFENESANKSNKKDNACCFFLACFVFFLHLDFCLFFSIAAFACVG